MTGQDRLALAALVARRFYLADRSQVEIAEELQLSRFQVARLLDMARANGIVHVEIHDPGGIDVELSRQVQVAFNLQHSIVINAPEDDDALLRQYLGKVCAGLLSDIIMPADVLGIGWARTVLAMRVALTHLAPCTVVQLTGSLMPPGVDESSVELVRAVGRMANGPAYYYFAPMVVGDAKTAAALRQHADIIRATNLFDSVTKAVVGVGGWVPPHSMLWDAITPDERQELTSLGTRADVSGVLLDGAGAPIDSLFCDRVIGISAAEMRRIPEVIAIAYGPEKAPAVRSAILGGYVNSLVTHVSLAQRLLGLS
jgi:DNA-binding transcriptional regulator LsrR (DeoR family)